ncbi:hypothetical protein SDC9_202107 [bioreactor metagenome]|uniref:Uncharacterized protein n=1 Tax=bioreactor metagenome TaxID=1076179 RepID=A0A645ITF1_9ZZZZ
MRGEEYGHAGVLLELRDGLPDAFARLRIQAGGRLVEKEDLWCVHQRARNVASAALTAGELAIWALEDFLDADALGDARDYLLPFSAAEAVKACADAKVLLHGEQRVEQTILKHRADTLADGVIVTAERVSVYDDLTRVRT